LKLTDEALSVPASPLNIGKVEQPMASDPRDTIRHETLLERTKRLDLLRYYVGSLENQFLGLRALELVLKHEDWCADEVGEGAAALYEKLARECVRNVGEIWRVSAPPDAPEDDFPF
jgi:hypothetical protein